MNAGDGDNYVDLNEAKKNEAKRGRNANAVARAIMGSERLLAISSSIQEQIAKPPAPVQAPR